jgi:hypothetical protein
VTDFFANARAGYGHKENLTLYPVSPGDVIIKALPLKGVHARADRPAAALHGRSRRTETGLLPLTIEG